MTVIVTLALVGYGYLWSPGRTLFSPFSDFVAEHAATKQVLYDSIHRGRGLPLWRSDQFSGYAGIINPQSQFTFPLQFLFFLKPPLAAVGGTFFLYFVAAGIAYYISGWALGLETWPRLFMSVAGMFSFKLIIGAYAGWLPNLSIVITFPLMFAALFHLAKRPGLGSALALAVAGALCLHAGHLQLFYYSFWFLAAFLAMHVFQQFREGRADSLWRLGLWLVPSGLVAVGLAAYLIWPLASEAKLLSRSQSSYEFFLSDHAISLRHLETFLYPEALGTPLNHSYQRGEPGEDELWEDVAYFGLIPLLLAVAGTILGWHRWPTKYLAVCFAATVLLSMNTLALRWLYNHLPGFQLFRIPARFLFLTTFFGISLAGIGLEEVLARTSRKSPRAYFSGGICAGLIALMAVEGSVYAHRYLKMVPYGESVPETAYAQYLARDTSLYRVAPIIRRTFNYAWAAPMELQIVAGMDSFNYRHYRDYFDLLRWNQLTPIIPGAWMNIGPENIVQTPDGLQPSIRYDLLDALNVKYILSCLPLAFPDGQYELVQKYENQPGWLFYHGLTRLDVYLYRNNHFLPRAFWAHQITRADGAEAAVWLIQNQDIRTVAVVMGSLPSVPSTPDPADSAEITEAWEGHLSVRTESKSGGYLVISELWHPGWRARLDDRPSPLYRTNYALLGALIPPGQHQLIMNFYPLHWHAALMITAVSFAILAAGLVVLLLRPGRQANP
ncbi:MAG TPA: hypothetical protein VMP11_07340 [Verrucomicrobiae bacterium]|nr:hypothetical protein [Verrucomicrobiae bacterium]